MRAADSRKPNVVVDQELPGRRTVLGPRARQLPLVVAVRALPLGVDNRPVGDIRKEKLDTVVELLRVLDGIHGDEPLPVTLSVYVPLLHGVTPTQRQPTRAVQHPASEIEVLIDHQNGCAQIPRTNGSGQAGTTASRDHNIGFVVPSALCGTRLRDLRAQLV